MNYTKIKCFSRIIFTNLKSYKTKKLYNCTPIKNQFKFNEKTKYLSSSVSQFKKQYNYVPIFAAVSIFTWNPFEKKSEDEDTPEKELIMTIKRSILCMQREEYAKAEQMLHLALRLAQQLNNKDGITYVYDVMANLAMEVNDYIKAEKLFVEVMRRLITDGADENDNKILHMSSKIAYSARMLGNLEKAKQGYEWTIQKIEDKLKLAKDDLNLYELCGLTKRWYAELLLDLNLNKEAKQCFLQAYNIYVELYGTISEVGLMILNNLGVVSMNLDDYLSAENYFTEVIKLSKDNVELEAIAALSQAHLGLVYIKKGLIQEAKELCQLAWKYGKKENDENTEKTANICLDEIKLL